MPFYDATVTKPREWVSNFVILIFDSEFLKNCRIQRVSGVTRSMLIGNFLEIDTHRKNLSSLSSAVRERDIVTKQLCHENVIVIRVDLK